MFKENTDILSTPLILKIKLTIKNLNINLIKQEISIVELNMMNDLKILFNHLIL